MTTLRALVTAALDGTPITLTDPAGGTLTLATFATDTAVTSRAALTLAGTVAADLSSGDGYLDKEISVETADQDGGVLVTAPFCRYEIQRDASVTRLCAETSCYDKPCGGQLCCEDHTAAKQNGTEAFV